MKPRILILGAGFGGMELSSILSETFGDGADVTLIDKGDAFVFGYSKLDVMFGRKTLDEVRMPYANFVKPGVRLLRETVTLIDPATKRVVTDKGFHEADYLVVALGADYDIAATPGLAASSEFYSFAGADRLRSILPAFVKGKVVIGVCAAPFKCPPAPSEAALLLHDFLVERGVRQDCEISVVVPFGTPLPPSPETSVALLGAFAERGIIWVPDRQVAAVDPTAKTVTLDDDSVMACDLLLGVPKHCAPLAVKRSGMAEDGWVPVDPRTLETRWPGVFAVGDIANTGTPKAGVFAEGESQSVAVTLVSLIKGEAGKGSYGGRGTCYFEFGKGRIAKVEVDFFSGPKPTGTFHAPSEGLRKDKDTFGTFRKARWFGM